jgi:hypothetical protein
MESRVRLQIRIGIKTMLIHNNGWFESKVAAIQFIEVTELNTGVQFIRTSWKLLPIHSEKMGARIRNWIPASLMNAAPKWGLRSNSFWISESLRFQNDTLTRIHIPDRESDWLHSDQQPVLRTLDAYPGSVFLHPRSRLNMAPHPQQFSRYF